MSFTRKIKAGLVKVSVNDFVGEDGNIFFDIDDGVLRLSDGATPGGIPLALGGGSGASTFRQLLDTPSSFSGSAGRFVKVNTTASAIEFVDVDLFDGDYNNLSNLPTLFNPSSITTSLIPQTDVAIDLGSITRKWRELHLSGSSIYLGDTVIRNIDGTIELPANAKINGKRIPLDVSELTDTTNLLGSGGVTSYNDLTDIPVLFSGSYNDLTDKPTLFSGSYIDLTNTPTIPTDLSELTDNTNLLAGAGGDGSYTLPIASNNALGGIKIGTGLSINESGVVSVTAVGVTSYNDLTDTPDLSVYLLATNAFSGSYADLTNRPIIPTNISAFINDAGYLTNVGTISYNDLSNLPSLFDGSYNDLTNLPSLFDGAYSSLSGTPDLSVYLLAANAFSGSYADLTNKPILVTSYNDLTDLPSIPVVPTTLSSFTNDSGYITGYTVSQSDVTQHQAALAITESQITDLRTYLTTVAFADLTSTPTTLSGYGIIDTYTSTQVDSAISIAVNSILDGAPELLDTLNEIAAAVGDDPNFITTINSAVNLKANSADLATVATTGSYNDLTNAPAIPVDVSELTDNTNLISGSNITEDDLIKYSILFG